MWPEEKDEKWNVLLKYSDGTDWQNVSVNSYYAAQNTTPLTEEQVQNSYEERKQRTRLDQAIRKFYESFVMESISGENNIVFETLLEDSVKVIFRDKHNNICNIEYNLKLKTISAIPITRANKTVFYRTFTKPELKFFDMLGFNLSDEHARITNQDITDWF